jgi:hypothetical protein
VAGASTKKFLTQGDIMKINRVNPAFLKAITLKTGIFMYGLFIMIGYRVAVDLDPVRQKNTC